MFFNNLYGIMFLFVKTGFGQNALSTFCGEINKFFTTWIWKHVTNTTEERK